MNIERELRTALLAMSSVTDIVVARIWDEWFRTSDVPSIVYEFDNEPWQDTLGGGEGIVIADVNIICRAETRVASRQLSDAVRLNGTNPGTGLAGYKGATFDAWLDGQN